MSQSYDPAAIADRERRRAADAKRRPRPRRIVIGVDDPDLTTVESALELGGGHIAPDIKFIDRHYRSHTGDDRCNARVYGRYVRTSASDGYDHRAMSSGRSIRYLIVRKCD